LYVFINTVCVQITRGYWLVPLVDIGESEDIACKKLFGEPKCIKTWNRSVQNLAQVWPAKISTLCGIMTIMMTLFMVLFSVR